MSQRNIRRICTCVALALVSAGVAIAQSTSAVNVPLIRAGNTWDIAQAAASSNKKLFVITLDQPHRRQTCHVQSFTLEKLVCSSGFGTQRTYLPQQIAAIILPGDEKLQLRMFLGFNGGLGAAIWGTIALAPICPACAAATALAALVCFSGAGVTAYGDTEPDRLVYLAPGQQLTGRFRSLKFLNDTSGQ